MGESEAEGGIGIERERGRGIERDRDGGERG